MDQTDYSAQLRPLPEDANFFALASMRMKLAWLSHTRPDCAYDISQLAQITQFYWDDNRSQIVKSINRTVAYVQKHPISIAFPQLDLSSISVSCFSDASFATNKCSITAREGCAI